MALQKITYAGKHVGDLWTAVNANEVKEVVNAMADQVDVHTRDIQDMAASQMKQVFLTQEQYDALVDAGTVDPDTIYNIYEE